MDVAVVGAGRVGTALAVLWRDAGHRIVGVAGSDATPARAARFLPGVPVVESADAARGAEVVVIATPDAVIAEVCRALASAGAVGSGLERGRTPRAPPGSTRSLLRARPAPGC